MTTLPAKRKLSVEDVRAIIKRWSELGIDEAFTNADLKAQIVDLLVEFDCPKWLAQMGVKILTPAFLYLAKGANKKMSKKASDKAIARLLAIPGVDRFFQAMNALEGKLIEKADAKKRFQAMLAERSPTAHDLNELLDPGLSGQIALMEQASDIDAGISELKAQLESNANPQPLLELHIDPPTDTTRFVYRSRAIPFVDDGESLAELMAFRDSEEMFSWYLILGSGGTGKSRLALEFLLDHAGEFGTSAGFLNMSLDSDFDWGRWQPLFPTFIVVDYAARQSLQLEKMFEQLSARKDLDWPVRILLLERQLSGSWYERILHQGRSARNRIADCAFDRPMELVAPDDVWPIVNFIVGNRVEGLRREETLDILSSIDPEMRPLYAAFMADALARGENPRGWERRALVENVLDHERINYWQPANVTQPDLNLVAVATMTAGYPLEWLDQRVSIACTDYLPRSSERNFQHRLAAIFGYEIVEAVPPLEPDILGEIFVLEQWAHASQDLKQFLVHVGGELAPWFADFFSRLTADFPHDVPNGLLKRILTANFGEYEPTRSELIYNTIMDFAPTRPQEALSLFAAFLRFELEGQTERDNLLVDQMEAAYNLTVGLPEDMVEERMSILEAAHAHLKGRSANDEHKAKFCEILSAFVDVTDGLDIVRFESVASDIVSYAHSETNNSNLLREAISALSAYVTAHSENHAEHSIDWYRKVQTLCASSDDEHLISAWSEAAYHTYILYRLKEDPSEGTAFLEGLETMGAGFAQELEDRYQEALRSLNESQDTEA